MPAGRDPIDRRLRNGGVSPVRSTPAFAREHVRVTALLARYVRDDLGRDDISRLRQHVWACEACRVELGRYRRMAARAAPGPAD